MATRELTAKQKEYVKNAHARWNFKTGATRSGKSFVDTLVVAPARILNRRGKDGLNVFLGVTETTLERNILEPMRKIYGSKLVSGISRNRARLFGEEVWCLGAEKISQVAKIQGMSIKYVLGDECARWNEEVFTMLKSRLDKEYSTGDFTCNPEHPKHFIKQFIDNQEHDIYHQHYTINDNTTLPASFITNLKKEYLGTVYYKRYIDGIWALAEGLVYPSMANSLDSFLINIEDLPPRLDVYIGVDFGKEGSDTAFCAVGIDSNDILYSLYSKKTPMSGKTFDQLTADFDMFISEFRTIYKQYSVLDVYCDSAEPTYINSWRSRYKDTLRIRGSIKHPIIDRIRATNILMGLGRIKIVKKYNDVLIEGLTGAVWDSKQAEDVRLDDGTSCIDILDAFEYAWEYFLNRLVRLNHVDK